MKMLPMILVLAATLGAPLSVMAGPDSNHNGLKCQFDPPHYIKNPPALQAKSTFPAPPASKAIRATSDHA